MANGSELYGNKWLKGQQIGKGGQGLTYHAQSYPEDGNHYVLKILKDQKNEERRERMFVEVSNLKILHHPNIPKFVDSNADKYFDAVEKLFLVSEYVNGLTLQEYLDEFGVFNLQDAITLTLKLCNIITYCHSKNVIHRDIKPDNIILKGNDINEPFLIDFGLSFNEEVLKGHTPSWQHIGNRFLSLPELRVSEGNKRDPRSDVTMVCAILLFCLTGVHPTDLLDETSTKPHRRENSKDILNRIEKNVLAALNRIFDIGFNFSINRRLQTMESLRSMLIELQNLEPNSNMDESNISKRLESFNKIMEEREDFKQLEKLDDIFQKINETIREAFDSVSSELPPRGFRNLQSGFNVDLSDQVFTNSLGFQNPYSNEMSFIPRFTCYVNGSELVLEAEEQNKTAELFRYPLEEQIDWKGLEEIIRNYYIIGLTSKNSK